MSLQFILKGYSDFEVSGKSVRVDWTPYLGNVTAFSILMFPNIQELDITGCDNVVANDFVDCVGFIKNLQILILDKCIQFSQYHFVKIFKQLEKIQKFSLVECCKIPFTPAYCICSVLHELQEMDFEPDNILVEKKDWKKLKAIFFTVKLGKNVKRISDCYW